MRCTPNGGDYEGVTAFLFTDDPSIELPVDSSVAAGCLQGALLRIVCRWPVQDEASEWILRRETDLLRPAPDKGNSDISGIKAQIADLTARLDTITERIARNEDVTAEAARASESQNRLPPSWWRRNR
jgi:hypothetical protein